MGGWLRGAHGRLGDRGQLGAGDRGGGAVLGRALAGGGLPLRAEAEDRGGAAECLLPVRKNLLRSAANVRHVPEGPEAGGGAPAAEADKGLPTGKGHVTFPEERI